MGYHNIIRKQKYFFFLNLVFEKGNTKSLAKMTLVSIDEKPAEKFVLLACRYGTFCLENSKGTFRLELTIFEEFIKRMLSIDLLQN